MSGGACIWAVTNQKGGVGKTTTAAALAGLLAEWELRVLLVDLDPHGSLSSYFGFDPECVEASLYDLFHADGRDVPLVQQGIRPGLDLVAASPAMATLDRQLGRAGGQGKGLVIRDWLHGLRGDYDHVLLDCAPTLGVLMINALVASDHVLVPTQTEYLALNGVRRMKRTIAMIERSQRRAPSWLIVPTMFDRRTRASPASLRLLREEFGHRVWGEVIPVDTSLREASRAGEVPSRHAPGSRGVEAYRRLLAFLLGQQDGQAALSA